MRFAKSDSRGLFPKPRLMRVSINPSLLTYTSFNGSVTVVTSLPPAKTWIPSS